jgi:hypothetical protein
MALGLSAGGSGGGEIQPYINYDAKAGRMFRVDRSQGGDGMWNTDKVEITNTVQMVMDLANIRVGWINYTTQGPVRKLVVLGQEPIPARPDDKNAEGKPAFKQGFEINLLLDKASGGGVPRVFGSAAGCVIEAMDALHDAYSALPSQGWQAADRQDRERAARQVRPVHELQADLCHRELDRSAGAACRLYRSRVAGSASAPSTGSTVVPPPAPQQAAMAGANDFG